jgi:adenylate kinase family enzyme
MNESARAGPGEHRILIFGNSGSGKSTMARALAREHGLAHLDLDSLAWDGPGLRRSREDSVRAIRAFVDTHPAWVVEGCYADLLEAALPFASEVRFLNPGVEACLANCRARPWEPEKYPSKEAQDAMLDFLLRWVAEYDMRGDEYSLARHRELFERFSGPRIELSSLPDMASASAEEDRRPATGEA